MTLRLPTFSEVLAVSRSRGRQSENPSAWDGLVGAWSMLQGGGATLFDVSGFGNNGVLANMDPATDWIVGEKGYALAFDSTNDAVNVGDFDSTIFSGDATVTALVRLTDASDSLSFLFDKRVSNGNGLLLFSNSGNIRSDWNGDSNSQGVFTENAWQHVVVRRKGTVVRHYIDGKQAGSDGSSSADASRATQAAIGSRSFGFTSSWAGDIAGMAVYNRALTPSEIQRQYADPNAMFRLKRRVSVRVPDVGGLSIPIAAYHYNHHLGA